MITQEGSGLVTPLLSSERSDVQFQLFFFTPLSTKTRNQTLGMVNSKPCLSFRGISEQMTVGTL